MRRDDVEKSVLEVKERFSGHLGFAARNLTSGEELLFEADSMFPTASVFKVAVMVEAFAQASEGRINLHERRVIRRDQHLGGTGVLGDLEDGLAPTIRDLVVLMIIVSDNTATNVLIDLLGGVERINDRINRTLGIRDFVLHRPIDFEAIGPDVRRLAEATPRGMMELLAAIGQRRLVGESGSGEMVDILRRQVFLDQFPRYIDYHRSRKELGLGDDLVIACKTGVFPGVRADAGLVFAPAATIAYCAMSEASSDRTDAVENEASVAIGKIGRLVVDYWWPAAADAGALMGSAYLSRPGPPLY